MIKPHSLPHHVTELANMRSYDNLSKTNVVLSSSEVEDFEAAARSVVEVTSWMDWWMFAAKSMALRGSEDTKMLMRLFVADACCQLLVANTVSTLWMNLILKCQDAVLTKVKDNISFESFMDFLGFPCVWIYRALYKGDG